MSGPVPVAERFWAKVDRSGVEEACWPWLGARTRNGYGVFTGIKHSGAAHRFAYELSVGPIPDGRQLDHLCRNRACVNPAHLEPVTSLENNRRALAAIGRLTHCPQGHAFTEVNTWISPRTHKRLCRTCARVRETRRALRSRRTI